MPQRSWLAKARSIHDLGPFYLGPKGGAPWDEKRDLCVEEKWRERLKAPLPVEPSNTRYFGSKMHDSWIVAIERTDTILRVRLDSVHAEAFATALANLLDRPPCEEVWPVDLLLHVPLYVRAARYDHRGGLRYADPYEIRGGGDEGRDEFLHDWFYEQDGRLQWIAELWCSRRGLDGLSSTKFLMVDTLQASAYDGRRAAIERAFGSTAGTLWQDVLEKTEGDGADYGLFSAAGIEDFAIRWMTDRGLTKRDFKP